ncbi:G-protein coupled receptor 157 isoform X2 [Brienomyrus brachyistius]|uniref:G-protein coupled receptor 157 isoform X2 n=1 Tax=Brienomyrus brachyistius TaxID=42636 RepID=UPI0020B3F904|nr:G-protein coupled receptor 157 isoform X2 [Brienomyrus brachyistius]
MHHAFHLISLTQHWGVPFVITVAAVCMHKIGYDASEVSVGWCWISLKASDHVLWMMLTGKIWELLAYLILPVMYVLIKKHIHGAHAALSEYRPILTSVRPSDAHTSMADRKMTLIPIIFIGLRIWSTIRFFLLLLGSPARQHPMLVTLHGIGNTLQGAVNCTLFVLFTQLLRSRLAALLCSCCCCWYTAPVSPASEYCERSSACASSVRGSRAQDISGPSVNS